MNQKLILGTVQFGLNYGINNSAGKPSGKDAFDILDIASQLGINCLDTADAYGDSISIIGQYHKRRDVRFKIQSKFKNVNRGHLAETAKKSLENLNIGEFEVYSFHSFSDYLDNQNLMSEVIELKSKGLVRKIGISVYTNRELEKVIEDANINVIQLPYNILDNENLRGIILERIKQKGKEIHIRSVFLQGLFFMDIEDYPEKLTPLRPYMQTIHHYCKTRSLSIQSLALSYALYNKNIDYVLIGVDTGSQLLKNIESIQNHEEAFKFINNTVFVKETDLLNPVNWK